MRLRNITGSREVIAESPYVVQEAVQPRCPGTWKEIFGNQNPVQIEIGMGKGKFIHTMAKEHPEINIQKLAELSGFLSQSNFIKLFSEKEGCTPAKWKKSNRE